MNIQFFLTISFIALLVYFLYMKDKKKKNISNNSDEAQTFEQDYEEKVIVTSVEDLEPKNLTETKVVKEEKYTYVKPPKDLLKLYPQKKNDDEEILRKTQIINDTLKDFKLNAKVCNVDIGAQLSVYEIQLIGNTRVQKVMDLENDLKVALGTKYLKMINPVPGKPTIGIEIPNDGLTCIGLRQMLKDIPNSKKGIVLGKNCYGNTKYIKFDDINNILIAGRPDSGKTMFLQNIIITTLLTTTPDEVRLIIIDPKKIEFNIYNGIYHFLSPVVIDPKRALFTLQRVVVMVDGRYETFKKCGTKNLKAYNEYVDKELKKNPDCGLKRMPHIIVIIDSYTDLIALMGKEITNTISLLAQHCSLAGIHLIVSISRPSTDMMSGDIKINIPNRISFDLSSGIDSKTILDTTGAENLFGNGDMLCKLEDSDELMRLQAPYISDEEIEKVINYFKEKNYYNDASIDIEEPKKEVLKEEEKEKRKDVLYDEVLNYAIRMGQISASLIQRKYGIGYNRAADIMDMFEEQGIIGPSKGSKPRDVLVKYVDEVDK